MDTNEELSSLTGESYGASLKCPLEEHLLWHNFFFTEICRLCTVYHIYVRRSFRVAMGKIH